MGGLPYIKKAAHLSRFSISLKIYLSLFDESLTNLKFHK